MDLEKQVQAPDDTLHVAGNIINTTSVSGTGDSGFQIANNHRLGFDQSGTRSWSVKATGGVLKIDSGDGNSAPQVRGILFGSDTADANKLNDYEEGTHSFTDASGASLSMSGSMIYTKIGRLVKVMFDISYPSTSSSANASVTLPFSASVAYGTGVVGWCSDPTFLHVANNTVSFMKNSASNSKHKSNSEVSGERFIGECSFFTNA